MSERKTQKAHEDEQGSAPATSLLYPPLPSIASGSFRTEQGMAAGLSHPEALPRLAVCGPRHSLCCLGLSFFKCCAKSWGECPNITSQDTWGGGGRVWGVFWF